MGEKYFKNLIIPFVLIISIVLMPLSFLPKKVEATGISGYIGGLTDVIGQLPLCQDKLLNLFSGGGKLDISGLTQKLGGVLGEKATGTLTKKAKIATDKNQSIPISLPEQDSKNIADIKAGNEEIKKATSSINTNDTCLQSIGRAIIKMLLQKITVSTVDWINGEMDGSPKFIGNSKEFFGDIAKNEILQFGIEINDPELFPFGEAFMKNQALSLQRHFTDNAEYSLDKMIADTNPDSGFNAHTFSLDFSQGGWGAWNALTQVPANNPLGFQLMASNELQKRLEGTSQSTAQDVRDSLKEAGGYLGVQKCRDPEGLSMEYHNLGMAERSHSPTGPYKHEICTGGWEYVTPGQMIATAATKTVNYPDNNLLNAQDLNDAVAAILDALLNKFSSSFMNENGFAGLADTADFGDIEGSSGGYVIDPASTEEPGSVVGHNYSSLQIAGSSFLQQNPNFNLATDLNQALIDEQRIFVDKILNQNKELLSKIPLTSENNPTGKYTGNYGLIPTINQLDYCIPGPHPGFEDDSRKILKAATDTIIPETTNSLEDRSSEEVLGLVKESVSMLAATIGMAIGASVLSIIPGIGTIVGAIVGAVVGYLVGWVIDLFSGDDGEELARIYYNAHFKIFTNTPLKTCKEGESCDGPTEKNAAKSAPVLHNKTPFVEAMNTILGRYFEIVKDVYTPEKLPAITPEANQKYLQLKGYSQMFRDNEENVTALRGVVVKLNDLKVEVDKLNQDLIDKKVKDVNGNIAPPDDVKDADGNIITMGQESQYNENLGVLNDQFARISQDMVAGDDIAIIENTTKQIIDETRYIYNILLKGPKGCEASNQYRRGASGKDGTAFEWPIYEARRPYYGIPILYDYNNFDNTKDLPDPFKSGYINRTPQAFVSPKTAILPGVIFENTTMKGNCSAIPNEWSIRPPLCLHDLVPLRNYSGWVSDRFEKVIGIY